MVFISFNSDNYFGSSERWAGKGYFEEYNFDFNSYPDSCLVDFLETNCYKEVVRVVISNSCFKDSESGLEFIISSCFGD